MRGREGVDGASSDGARHPQQEFDSFLRWLETIESAKRPADLDNFLMREMATQLARWPLGIYAGQTDSCV